MSICCRRIRSSRRSSGPSYFSKRTSSGEEDTIFNDDSTRGRNPICRSAIERCTWARARLSMEKFFNLFPVMHAPVTLYPHIMRRRVKDALAPEALEVPRVVVDQI